jgi:hypothetical protein
MALFKLGRILGKIALVAREQKITLGEMRHSGPRRLLVYSGDSCFFLAMGIFAHSWKLFRGPAHTLRSFQVCAPGRRLVADELRRQADAFLELDDLKAAIGRH